MKKKIVVFPFVFGLVLSMAVKNADAYTVTISKSGVVASYREILGDEEDRKEEDRKEEGDGDQREEEKREEKKEDPVKKETEIKRENLKVEVSPGRPPKIEVKQERVENRREVEMLQRERETLLTDLERKTEKGTLTREQREAMKQKIEVEKKKENELRERTIRKVEDREMEVKIEGGESIESVGDELEIKHGRDRVRTALPVVVDVETRRMRVKTETGEEVEVERIGDVTDKLRGRGLIDDLSESQTGTSESELRRNDTGELVYDLAGTKKERLFGLLPVNVERQIEVSAQSGEVVGIDQTFVSGLLDLFSF